MKTRTRNAMIRVCSVAMVALTFTGFALSGVNGGATIAGATNPAGENRASLTDVSDKFDTTSLRTQYLDSKAVEPNTTVKNEERWVIVDLGGNTLIESYLKTNAESFPEYVKTREAKVLQEKAERNNQAFLSKLSQSGIKYEWKYSYSTLNNGVAVKVRNADVEKLKKLGGVKDVYASESYAVPYVTNYDNNANTYTTGIYDTSEIEGYDGEGMTVAVLDTGLDYTHAAFQNMPAKSTLGMDKDHVDSVFNNLESHKRNSSMSVSDVYYNDKVPYAFDYADDDADVYPSYSSHGTHVAGIIAGRDDSKIVNVETEEKFIGVAPEAQLVICKVFTDNLDNKAIGGANAIDILASLADCVTLGVDVINMSLGTSVGFSEEGYATAGVLQDVYERIDAAGISLVVAASNDYSSGFGGAYGTNLASNPDSGTVGSPSTYAHALSVASINGQKARYFTMNGNEDDVAFITDSSNANGKAYNFIDELYEKTGTDKSEPLTLNYVVVGGVGRTSNYTTSVKNALRDGKTIAVVKRGDINFAEKVQNAMVNGALACIIYNNVSGNIRMTLGEVNDPIPTCSITMDAGKLLTDGAKNNRGTVTFKYENAAGPFMSDFSSWGPTPDLKLKPEITAHGGEITSAVPGGYEKLSGTSMAAPNMSGAIALLRQYAQQKWTDLSPKEIRTRVNQLLMSTATMAVNEEGNPYSPRKQGAGLAGILDSIQTQGYLTVEGNEKPKLELGDDPKKTGVYEMNFTVNSISDTATSYTPEVFVMTESLSTDGKTVAEKAYMLEHCTVEVIAGGQSVAYGSSVTVPAHGKLDVKMKVTLDDSARKYLDETFKNGMYVEGFVRLKGIGENTVELGLPFLAFYGDWMKAPMFDYSTYEVEESEADKSVDEADKLKASAAATRPLGMYNDDEYIVTLGSYLYEMEDNFTKILPSSEHAALSCYDYQGRRTVYELYVLYAGLLRPAKTMQIDIVDVDTGEVIYSHLEENVRKSYAAGGSNVGSMITLKIDPLSWNLSNNKKYTATFTGKLDYDGEGTTERNSFTFDFTIDTEAPRVLDYRLRYEPYTDSNKETKYRIYLDADVYDNQYAMSFMPCYLNEKDELALLSHYPVPIYSTKGDVTTVTYEVTDCFEEYVKTGNFYLAVQDYALNEGVFQVNYTGATEYPTELTLKTDDKLVSKGNNKYELTLEQYERYTFEAEELPLNTAVTALTFTGSDRVKCNENQVFTAYGEGYGTVTVTNADGKKLAEIEVKIVKGTNAKPLIEKIKLAPMLNGSEYLVSLEGLSIELNPNSTRQLVPMIEPWYGGVDGYELEYRSGNTQAVTVDENGLITTHAKGIAYVTVSLKNSNVSTSLRVTVGEELDITNNVLYHYYGGKDAVIPDSKNILSIDDEAFKDNTLLETIRLPISVTQLPENCFSGCINLREVYLPAECTIIKSNAFKDCVSLEKIVLYEAEDKITNDKIPGTLTIGRSAFEGCVKLKTIENQARITTAFDRAFAGCTSLQTIDISGLRVGGNHIFENCTSLETVTMSALTHVGNYMFSGCEKLNHVVYKADRIPAYAFSGCASLNDFTLEGVESISEIGAYAFAGTAFTSFTLPNGEYTVGGHAFGNCENLASVALSASTDVRFGQSAFYGSESFVRFEGTSAYHTVRDGVLYNADCTELVNVPLGKAENFALPDTVEVIGSGAFAGTKITSVDLSGIRKIGAYAFAESRITAADLSGVSEIPNGAFYKCDALTSVVFSNQNTVIGDYAFAECTSLRQRVEVPDVREIGIAAFMNAPVMTIAGDNIEKIGAYAFYGTRLYTQNSGQQVFDVIKLPKLTELGSFAFASVGSGFRSIELGPVKQMGSYVFADTYLTNVTFAEGTEVIGDWAFVTAEITLDTILTEGITEANTRIARVKIPGTVKKIGEFAFLNAQNLLSSDKGETLLDFSGVEEIGMGAFWLCAKLTDADLRSVITVGDYAFAESGLTAANLQSATKIGIYAFSSSKLKQLTLGAVKQIGANSFGNTQIETINIPKSFDSLTYLDSWTDISDFGDDVPRTDRYFYAYGSAAFAFIPTLNTITVEEGNPAFFTDDNGVLYGIISGDKQDGKYVLLQYPMGNTHNEGNSYTVLDNTVRIGDGAFYGVKGLNEIKFPQTVRAIGSLAFFNCSATHYYFESVQAPVLEAAYDETVANVIQDGYAFLFGIYYSNFYNYVAAPLLAGPNYDFKLTLHCPENGVGYDNKIWQSFFSTVEHGAYAAEELTLEVQAMIAALPAAETVKTNVDALASQAEKLAYIKNLSKTEIAAVRARYNLITSQGQRALIAEDYEKLLSLEAFVRNTCAELGEPVEVTEIVMAERPKYAYFIGESFDDTGMVIKAVYADTSEVVLTAADYTVSNVGPFTEEDKEIVFTYAGKTCTLFIRVVPNEVTGIEIKQNPKTEYSVGESFDDTGMVIVAVYADGSEVVLAKGDYEVSNAGPFTEEDKEITFTYQGKTCTLAINVTPAEEGKGCGSCNGSIAASAGGIAIGATLVLITVGAVLFVKKKKN